jgi:hypothetical protein
MKSMLDIVEKSKLEPAKCMDKIIPMMKIITDKARSELEKTRQGMLPNNVK